jgi:ribosomal protein S18 acetylase RimI-like enzyme
MIHYTDSLNSVTLQNMKGFFAGWQNHPSPEKHLEILKNSAFIVLAIDEETNNVIGFINAVSDKVLSSYIPLLEVLPDYQGKGIGKELVKRMLAKLEEYYMIDICCDESLQKFYEKFGLKKYSSMIIRNYSKQSGI